MKVALQKFRRISKFFPSSFAKQISNSINFCTDFRRLFQVIFSHSSQDLHGERLSSAHSSMLELREEKVQGNTPENDSNETDTTFPPTVFKEFDFLDGEPDSMVR